MISESSNPLKLIVKIVVGVVAALTLLIAGCNSVNQIPAGHVGVRLVYGEVVGEPIQPGLEFVNPISTDIVKMNVRTTKWAQKVSAYTRDVQQAEVNFALNYNLDSKAAAKVYDKVGPEWVSTLVGQVVAESIEQTFGQYNAVDIVSQREEVARRIETQIRRVLAARDVQVPNFQVTGIDFTAKFEASVEAKVVAQQDAIREQNKTVQIAELAKQQVATAKGNAEATVLNATAEAESIKIRAKALEQNAKLVEWEAVQKWNGVLPQYSLGGAVPFINVPAQK